MQNNNSFERGQTLRVKQKGSWFGAFAKVMEKVKDEPEIYQVEVKTGSSVIITFFARDELTD